MWSTGAIPFLTSYNPRLFGVDHQRLFDANMLSSSSVIFPFTSGSFDHWDHQNWTYRQSLLLPNLADPHPPRPRSSDHNRVRAGVGIGADLLVLVFTIFGFLFWYRKSLSTSLSPLQNPTHCQSFKGNTAAVKVMKGDVSNEIDILKMINNSNVIRLSGFYVHEGNTHLVYHFTENGSLADWLLSNDKYRSRLAWMQIIQIAHDVADALNCLLNYTNPLYIHENLKTSNILLDANLRAKLADIGLAITLESDQDGGFQSTRHDSGYSKLFGPLNTYKMESAPRLASCWSSYLGRKQLQRLLKKSSGDELLSVTIVRVLEVDNVRETLWLPIPLGSSLPNGPAG